MILLIGLYHFKKISFSKERLKFNQPDRQNTPPLKCPWTLPRKLTLTILLDILLIKFKKEGLRLLVVFFSLKYNSPDLVMTTCFFL
jgi:hypothetical protein